MDKFTINKINTDGSIDVTFSSDNKKQNLSGFPVGDKEALVAALSDYAIAYKAGLDVAAPDVVAPEVTAIVGKAQDVVVDAI